jgi:hypothetical protein
MRKLIMQHGYEIRPRKERGGVDLISDTLPFGRLWFRDANAAVRYARFVSHSHRANLIVYDASGAVLHRDESFVRSSANQQEKDLKGEVEPAVLPPRTRKLISAAIRVWELRRGIR